MVASRLSLPSRLPIGPLPRLALAIKPRKQLPQSPVSPFFRGQTFPFELFRPQPAVLWVRWQRIADFVISRRERRITIYPMARVSARRLRTCLLHSIASFALVEEGIESLHASAVARNGFAIAFLGEPGSGKSTLAALLVRRGSRVLADDLLAIQPRRHTVVAWSGVPELKLSPAAARALGLRPRRLPRVEPREPKRIWRAPGAQGSQPLAVLYFPRLISPRGRIRLLPLSRRATFWALLGFTYNATLLARSRQRRQFSLLTRMARLPGRRLLIPRGLHKLDDVAERIEQDLAELDR